MVLNEVQEPEFDVMSRVSIIIPTLNEASCLGSSLRPLSLLDPPAWEVLVVDGGSEDGTVAIKSFMMMFGNQPVKRSVAKSGECQNGLSKVNMHIRN